MFTGFTPETIDFLWGIRMNNNREWFMANKKNYTKFLYEPMKELGKVIDLPGLAVGLLVIVAGLFLYCSLAAIGGALASKQEDLAQTNYMTASFFSSALPAAPPTGSVACPQSFPTVCPKHHLSEFGQIG